MDAELAFGAPPRSRCRTIALGEAGCSKSCRRFRAGFTLVELLIVIAIIAMLAQLLLPAIQAAREAARRTQCKSNLRQVALAWTQHHDTHGFLPTGGWGSDWVGDADRGSGTRQPGGWVYNILPFIEQQNVYALGAGQPIAEKDLAHARRSEIPIPLMNCPSRRPAIGYAKGCCKPVNSAENVVEARSCYAANCGESTTFGEPPIPKALDEGDSESFPWADNSTQQGISFIRSKIAYKDIEDGTTNTYMVGEKHVDSEHYLDSLDPGDDWPIYTGLQDDIYRSTGKSTLGDLPDLTPLPDSQPHFVGHHRFGGPHPAGVMMAFADGSVRHVEFDIDAIVHRQNGNRSDNAVTQ